VVVARDLLGKYLVREVDGQNSKQQTAFKIMETEGYEGLKDKASHVSRGQTPRNSPMWEHPGTIYIYFVYGFHYMLNVTCGKKGHPAAVLIRGVEGCVGPGRLTKKLFIDKSLNGKMLGKKSRLWIEERIEVRGSKLEIRKSKFKIKRTPRIGVAYAGPVWSKKLYRFVLA
jgi:DNA-3-methyladenine glycosylase